jgi:ElaB/YqjD/DUF883 family membrane-anchored ribosome-binding protein
MASEVMDRLVADLKTLTQDVRELITQTAGQSGERVASARARAEQSLSELQERLAPLQEEARARAREAARATSDYVHEHPAQIVAVLAALALLAALIFARRED